MNLRIVVASVILAAAATILLAKGPSMKPQGPFTSIPFEEFNVEAQNFIPGLGDKNFQIMVPTGKTIDQVEMDKGHFQRARIALDKDGISTDYALAPTGNGFYLFEGCGVSYFNSDGSKRNWAALLSEQFSDLRLDGPAYSMPDGSAVTVFSHTGKGDVNEAQLIRFRPETSDKEILLTLPKQTADGILQRIDLPHGFITTRSRPREIGGEQAQFYDLDGKPSKSALANAINTLRNSKIDLRSPGLSPVFGALYPSQTKDTWALFPWKGLTSHPDKRLFLLSVTDTIQAIPVTCERHSLEPSFSLRFVLIHPRLNLFLVGIRLNPKEQKVEMYLGRIQKEGTSFKATT